MRKPECEAMVRRKGYLIVAVVAVWSVATSSVWAYGAGSSSSGGFWSLPERAVYSVLAIPGRVVRTVFPRTSSTVRSAADSARQQGSRAVSGVADVGKRLVIGTGKVARSAFQTVLSATQKAGAVAQSVAGVRR